jgi:selenocysteine-specific elongation factor
MSVATAITTAGSRHFILATAGHVDHGKSALVKALTGVDPDRLPEEKSRGITIDLGFAHLELPSANSAKGAFSLGIVDVPGHEDFVKNMVAGVGSIDLALLVVAADDGWMPQTEEHLQILSYLGVSRAVVALTKIDLAADEQAASGLISERLNGTPFANAAIVPTSVVNGRGLEDMRAALACALANAPLPADIGKPRLAVDRVFTLRGAGTIVTGTLSGGSLRRGQEVAVQPSGRKTRIRNMQSHGRNLDLVPPGTRVALNLPELNALTDIHRGDVVTLGEFGDASDTVDVLVEISSRATCGVKDRSRVNAHHGSAKVPARLAFLSCDYLAPGTAALAQLRLDAPTFLFAGDRFLLRDWGEKNTLAGGMVLDPDASRKFFRGEARRKLLNARAAAPQNVASFLVSEVAQKGATHGRQLLVRSRFSAPNIANAARQLAISGQVIFAGDLICDATWWRAISHRAAEAIDELHRNHPQRMGLPLTELRRIVEKELQLADVFDALVASLCRGDFIRVGAEIRRAAHHPALPPQLQLAAEKLRSALNSKPFDPPSRKELASEPIAQQALRFLLENREAVEVNAEIVLATDHFQRAAHLMLEFIRENGPATVSQLREALGSSRRVVVPLLERLDREGVTVRQGDKRSLRR